MDSKGMIDRLTSLRFFRSFRHCLASHKRIGFFQRVHEWGFSSCRGEFFTASYVVESPKF